MVFRIVWIWPTLAGARRATSTRRHSITRPEPKRTLSRIVRREELWTGNREQFRMAFASRDSLFIWARKSHWKKRRVMPERLADPRYAHLRVTRIRSPREPERFLAACEAAE